MSGTKREPPILNLPRENRSLRDLEDPTHAFPIGAATRAPSAGAPAPATKKRRVTADDMLDLSEAPITPDDDDYDFPELPSRKPMIDARLVALWLVAATLLAVLAGLAAAVAVVYL
jgi:hypothetical protein